VKIYGKQQQKHNDMENDTVQLRPPTTTDNPLRLAAFAAYYGQKQRFESFGEAWESARRGNWICRVDNQVGGEFFTLHVRFKNPPFNRAGFIYPGAILGRWNEITYIAQKQ
jgi:hypothetical protein